jgi:hypothetical protein
MLILSINHLRRMKTPNANKTRKKIIDYEKLSRDGWN